MSLNLRIFLAYFFVVGVAISLLLNVLLSELKPSVRQSTEDALVDMSNLLAEIVSEDFTAHQFGNRRFAASMDRFLERSSRARIYSIDKPASLIRVYITDAQGVVRYDSEKTAVGQDYSRWNDVYLTLRGKYGARSTPSDPDDEFSAVMHVAAPILKGDEIVGVLTVAKPNLSVQPFIDIAREKIQSRGVLLVLISLFVAVVLSWWLTSSIRKLVRYSDKIARGERLPVPEISETELAKLAGSIDNMRRQLEGKEYVEKYVHALTHELKSPVSAIKGASEIINADMPAVDLSHFMSNIQYEVDRIDEMINRLLALVTVEKREVLEQIELVDMVEVIGAVMESKQLLLAGKGLELNCNLPSHALTTGDRFLLTQLFDNVLQNAVDFSLANGTITVEISGTERLVLTVRDHGVGIPDFAVNKIFDRFYSLARPVSKKKSSGLGLSFVKQIVELHGGKITVENQRDDGVLVTVILLRST